MFFAGSTKRKSTLLSLLRFMFPSAEIRLETETRLSPDEVVSVLSHFTPLLSWRQPRSIDVYESSISLDLGDLSLDLSLHHLGGWNVSLFSRHLLMPDAFRVPTTSIDNYVRFIDLVKTMLTPYSTDSTKTALDVMRKALSRLTHLSIPVDLYGILENDDYTTTTEQPQVTESKKLRKMLHLERAILFSDIDLDSPLFWYLQKIVKQLGTSRGMGILIPECSLIDIAYPEELTRIQFHPAGKTIVLSPRHLYLTTSDKKDYIFLQFYHLPNSDVIGGLEVYIPKNITREEGRMLLDKIREVGKKLLGTVTEKIYESVKEKLEDLV